MVNISSFETEIDKVILKRGREYFLNDHVEGISEVNKSNYHIEVLGSDVYKVTVQLDNDDNISRSYCDCPYDLGEYCKHEVAAFYAIKSYKEIENKNIKSKNIETVKNVSLKGLLLNLHKDKLIKIICDIATEYPQIEKHLLLKLSLSNNELQASKDFIIECINRYKKRGFIAWNDVENALMGAELILRNAREELEMYEIETAVSLSLIVLSSVVKMLDYCDDSLGYPGEMINECLELIETVVSLNVEAMDDLLRNNLFTLLIKEASSKKYDGFIEWIIHLLRSASLLINNNAMRSKLERKLRQLVDYEKDSSRSNEYNTQQVMLLQFDIINRFDGKSKAFAYMIQNVKLSSFREMAIEHYLYNNDYLEVLKLCEEGIEVNKNYIGLVRKWRKYQLEAYKGLKDSKKQEKLMLEFLYNNEYEYYQAIKAMYSQEQWTNKLQEILDTFEKMRYIPTAYIEILKCEGLTGKILNYCQHHKSFIVELYQYLLSSNVEEANTLYTEYIEKEAFSSMNRSQYRQVCKLIRQYIKVSDKQKGGELIKKLKQTYVRRPAFIDELSKL